MLEKSLFDCQSLANADTYSKWMAEWTISSDSFAVPTTGELNHFYDSIAKKSSGASASGKRLVKEAKKCKRMLPTPIPDASIFLVFEEKRMDVGRVVISGTADTPYSLGLFVFDIFFPAMFPASPPLVTFMTTGKPL